MLETLHVRSAICVRLRSGRWARGSTLSLRRWSDKRMRLTLVLCARRLRSAWLARHGIAVGAIDAQAVARFANSRRRWPHPVRPGGRQDQLVGGVGLFAAFLWEHGGAVRHPCVAPATAVDHWVDAFTTHLTQVRGASRGTRQIYRAVRPGPAASVLASGGTRTGPRLRPRASLTSCARGPPRWGDPSVGCQ